jgi:uncharacterized membrane protein YedE/YeeE
MPGFCKASESIDSSNQVNVLSIIFVLLCFLAYTAQRSFYIWFMARGQNGHHCLGTQMEHFTPLSSLLGGALIGLSATLLLISNGRAAGISGILSGIFTTNIEARSWRLAFLLGLLLAGLIAALVHLGPYPSVGPLWRILLAGLLVGFGTRLGEGCTSGHGVCGLSRLSFRSLVATITFMAVGMLVVRLIS